MKLFIVIYSRQEQELSKSKLFSLVVAFRSGRTFYSFKRIILEFCKLGSSTQLPAKHCMEKLATLYRFKWPGLLGLILLCQFCRIEHSFAYTSPTDSLLALLNTLPENERRLEVLIELTDMLNWQDLEKAKQYGFEALRLGERLDDPIGMAYAMIEISHNYDSYMNKDSSMYYALEAIDLFKKENHPAGKAQGYLRLGYIAENEADFEAATQHLFKALSLFELAKDEAGTTKAFIGLGKLYFKMDKFEEGIDLVRKVDKAILADASGELSGYYHLVMGNNHKGAGLYDQALYHYEKCAEIAQKNGLNIDLIYTNTFMADIFQEQGKYDLAREFYQKAIEYAKVYKDKNLETFPYIGSGRLYNKQGEYERALEQFRAAMERKFDRVHNYYFHEIYRELSVAHEGLGNHDIALQNMVKYSTLRDSFFTERADRLRSEMQAKYESEKKEQAIQQKQKELSFAIFIVILLAISAVTLWKGYLNKRKTNRILQSRNEEKEFLIKEIHHRVKNNLQILSSLLNLQADYMTDPAALNAVEEGRNRVQSMGLIHQKLYMGEDLASVKMEDYVRDLTSHLLTSYGMEKQIEIRTSIKIPPLDLDSAIPLGLIINELFTNSLKHAFPEGQNGVVIIKIWINRAEELCLLVSDNGVGPMEKPSKESSTSFGTDLVRILSKKLKGKIKVSLEDGYQTLLRFSRYRVSKETVG